MANTLTEELADFICELRYSDIPSSVIDKTRIHILDSLGAQLVGSQQPWNVLARRYARQESPNGRSTFVGEEVGGRPEWVSFSNATSAQGFEVDDYHPPATCHPGALSVPPALAIAEDLHASDEEFLCAVVIAAEVAVRMGLAAAGGMGRGRGINSQSAIGPFAVAAATGKLSKVDRKTLVAAFGIAGCHSGGVLEYTQSGGETKRLFPGLGCIGGIRSVTLAASGLTGPSTILEGSRGIYQAFSDRFEPNKITDGLGEIWGCLDAALKRYSANAFIQAPLRAIHEMIAEDGLVAEEVDEIVVGVDPFAKFAVGAIGPHPHEMMEAQFSIHFSLGMALTLGGNDFLDYQEAEKANFNLPKAIAIGEKVRLKLDDEATRGMYENYSCILTVTRKNKPALMRRVQAPGSPSEPLSFAEVTKKFRGLGSAALDASSVNTVEQLVMQLPDQMSLARLSPFLRQAGCAMAAG